MNVSIRLSYAALALFVDIVTMPAKMNISTESSSLAPKIIGIVILFLVGVFAIASIKLNVLPWEVVTRRDYTWSRYLLDITSALPLEIVVLMVVAVIAVYLVVRNSLSHVDNSSHSIVLSTTDITSSSQGVTDVIETASPRKLSLESYAAKESLLDTQHSAQGNLNTLDLKTRNNLESQVRIANNELDKVRRELVNCREELAQANLAKSEFLTNMSRELLTPMNGIVGTTDLLMCGELKPREERFVKSIAVSAGSVFSMITDLLDYTKIESGILKIEKAEFSIRECVEDVCSIMAACAHEKKIELISYVDESVAERMEGDPHRIQQVINNLVANAIAYTETGEVVVRISRCSEETESNNIQCEVQDTGIGITPEMQAQLFSAFAQQESSLVRSQGGIGLGLAITKELVTMMGGELTFESRLKQGTRFSFTIPLNELSDDDELHNRRRNMAGAHVLVVDDNDTNRTILYHQLTNWGLVVETTENGMLALQMLRESHSSGHAFDAVLFDLHMPVMDGLELAKNIQADPKLQAMKSVLLTSTALPLDANKLHELGIYRFLNKPVRQSLLHECLVSALSNQSGTSAKNTVDYLKPKNAHVLLVEDNLTNRGIAIEMLQKLGCQVSVAENGDAAVCKGCEEKFDIVLMDCQMPLMDGYEATRQMKMPGSLNAKTPIIALTANASTGDREQCLDCGMDDYVSKPVVTRTLSQLLDKWVSYPMNQLDAANLDRNSPILFTGARESDLRPSEIQANAGATESALDHDALASGVKQMFENNRKDDESVLIAPNDDNSSSFEGVINPVAIQSIRAMQRPGKEDLLLKIVNAYSTKTLDVLDQLTAAVNDNNAESVVSMAKGLAVSSEYLGADVMTSVCKHIQSVVKNGETDDLATLISSLRDEYQSVSVELKEIVKAA